MFLPKSVSVIIIKPTKICNAHCTHCSSPQEDDNAKGTITLEKFEYMIQKLQKYLHDEVDIIWHGGEPLLMEKKEKDYYFRAWDIANKYIKNPKFSLQTNMLLYNKEEHLKLFSTVFDGRISTSYDFFSGFRQINGSQEKYDKLFFDAIERFENDTKQTPFVITIINKFSKDKAKEIFDIADGRFNIRTNHLYTVGRAKEGKTNNNKEVGQDGKVIDFVNTFDERFDLTSDEYADFLVEYAKLWLESDSITKAIPIWNLLRNYLNNDSKNETQTQCPWLSDCNGKFLGIEPNGDIYNCADYADVELLKFGNIYEDDIEDILHSNNSKLIHKRSYNQPQECMECEFYYACKGGCQRDSINYNGDIYGKFFFCSAWKNTFYLFQEYEKTHGRDFLINKLDF